MGAAAVAVPSSGDAPVSGVRTSLGLGCVCKRSRGSPRCLPRERVELEGRAGSLATRTGGGSQRWARGQVDAGLLRDPELHGSTSGVPAKLMEESAWPERHRL